MAIRDGLTQVAVSGAAFTWRPRWGCRFHWSVPLPASGLQLTDQPSNDPAMGKESDGSFWLLAVNCDRPLPIDNGQLAGSGTSNAAP